MGRLSPDQIYASITNQTKELICEDFEVEQQKIGYNALMLAVDFVHVFKEHLSWMQKYQLRLDYHPESMISILLNDLTPEQQLTVILQENSEHRNALHLTEREGALTMYLLQYVPLEHMAKCISSLDDTQWESVLQAAVKEKNNYILSCILQVYGDRINEEKIDITNYTYLG